jgi:hypothetical protein
LGWNPNLKTSKSQTVSWTVDPKIKSGSLDKCLTGWSHGLLKCLDNSFILVGLFLSQFVRKEYDLH